MNMKNNAVLIQCGHTLPIFVDMMRLTYQRHAAYTMSHNIDYWHLIWSVCPERDAISGAWDKIELLKLASTYDYYDYMIWMDTDAAVVSDVDLRLAIPEGKSFGACLHDWERVNPQRCRDNGLFTHHNVGVLYFRNDDISREFLKEWADTWPGDKRWHEQGIFNEMIKSEKYAPHFATLDDKWNATIDINECEDMVVKGFHGIFPYEDRLTAMARDFSDDVFRFRVR